MNENITLRERRLLQALQDIVLETMAFAPIKRDSPDSHLPADYIEFAQEALALYGRRIEPVPAHGMHSDPAQPKAVHALLQRAQTGLLSNVIGGTTRPDQFDFWQGYAKALRDLQNGTGDKLAAKDAALHGYQLPRFLQSAADLLGGDIYFLPRDAVVERLAKAGLQFPADDVADLQVVPAEDFKHAAVIPGDLNGEHAPHRVDGDDGALHGVTPGATERANVAQEGGAA